LLWAKEVRIDECMGWFHLRGLPVVEMRHHAGPHIGVVFGSW
jgi:hypothetical protein